MRLKRFGNVLVASVLSLSALFNVTFPSLAHAATVSWDGGAGNHNLNAPTNWSNDAVPTLADTVTINVSSLTADTTFDATAPIAFGSLAFTGTKSGDSVKAIVSGSPVTIGSSLSDTTTGSVGAYFDSNVVLDGDAVFSGFSGGSTAAPNQTVDLNGHNLTANDVFFNKVTGTGNITVANGGYATLVKANTGWSGAFNVSANAIAQIYPGSVGAANPITITNTGVMATCAFNGATVASPLTVGGNGPDGYGALSTAPACNMGAPSTGLDPKASVVWSGAITLTSNTVVGGKGEFKVTGALSGNFTLTQASGTDGKVTIASTSNTSGTPNGTQTSPTLTTEYKEEKPTESIYVSSNNVAVVDGTYADATVSPGGVLMGTGTVGNLDVNAGGKVAPGHSPGCLNSGNLVLAGTYEFEVGGTTACTGYDQINVTGTVDATGGTLTASIFNNYKATAGEKYVIINNDGTDAVTGTFAGLAEGATFAVGTGGVFRVSYVGGTGNDIELTVVTAPTVPDTGFALLTANPFLTLSATVVGAGALMVAARRVRA